ncbi:retention module-containing protein [Parahaliea mediterranea]|uniref:Retention module-containing protein n=1 Tax=Parahaliea mediterranea TaxID=651086 RepID=A0A939IKQ5_9GAMM|nr:retention module-containing protein [Parahaliea mediterranea]MBN7795690.1 retention module-containing protein [Parahaliea mediterranea]
MANVAIATVVAVEGKAFARNAEGELRELSAGDVLLEGETVVTPDGAQVELSMADGNPFAVRDVDELTLSRDLLADRAAGADESAVEDASVEAVLAALEGDQDIGDVLEATAAGGASGSGGAENGGHSWVRLGRVVENTSEFSGLAAPAAFGDEAPVDQAEAIIPVDAIDDSETTEEGEPVVIDVQRNDDFIEGSTVTAITQPANGSAVINPDNTVTYTPDPGFTGVDTFTYTAITPDGNNGDTAVVTVTVTGDPAPPPPPPEEPPTLSIDDVTVVEGDVATLTVTLSEPSDEVVTVVFASADDSATVTGGDYNPETGEITFAPGQTTVTLQVQTNPDNLTEGTEHFFVNLSDPSGAEIADGQGVVTIIEPDPAPLPSISINDVTVVEGATAAVTLSLSAASDQPVTVQFASADGSATVSGGDYDPDSGTVTFAPGQTEVTILFGTNTDTFEEGVEQFLVNLSNATNATIADDQGIVTIVDGTEPPPPPPPPPPQDDEPALAVDGGAVDEAALSSGSNAPSTAETTSGAFSITTGVDSLASLVVAGQDVTGGGVVQGQYGTLTVTVSGGAYSWSYTLQDAASHPNAGSTGTAEGVAENFAVTVTDDDGDTASANLVVDILDDGPSAVEDSNSAAEGGEAVTGNVLANDSAGADAPATVTGLAGGDIGSPLAGSHGSLVLQGDGSYIYTPNASVPEGAQDVFTYEITDADGDTASTTLTISFEGDNSAPSAQNGAAATGDAGPSSDTGSLAFDFGSDTPVTFAASYDGGLGGASQASAGGLTTFSADDGSWQLVINETTGAYTFTQLGPYAHAVGDDSDSAVVSVTLTDSDGSVANASLSLSIADDGPTALADGGAATEGGPGVTGNVMDNDTAGADGGATVTGITGGTVGTALTGNFGTLTLGANGDYTYTPNASVPAGSQDVFTYEITDADGDTASTTLTITFAGDNSAPSAQNGIAATGDAGPSSDTGSLAFDFGSDTPVSFAASYDGGLGSASQASAGGLTIFSADDGSWQLVINETTGAYTFTQLGPYAHAVGDDSDSAVVSVTLTDSDGSVANATLSLSIADDGPFANDDGPVLLGENQVSVLIDVFDNDAAGADGVDLASGVSVTTGPTKGSVQYNNDGTFTYTPDAEAEGADSFTYTIIDSDGDTSTATVNLDIESDSVPTVSVVYSDAGGVVDEAALPTGSDANSDAESTSGTFNITHSGSDTTQLLVIDGVDVTNGGTVGGDYGTLEVTLAGGVYSWRYTLDGSTQEHPLNPGSGSAEGIRDQFNVVVTDSDNDTDDTNMVIDILDDGPVATDDGNLLAVEENASAVNVGAVDTLLDNDHFGADGEGAPSISIAVGDKGGSITIDGSGNLLYTNTTQSVANGETEVETFVYTITDGDGDTSTAQFTVTLTDGGVGEVLADTNLVADDDDALTPVSAGNPGGPEDDTSALSGQITYSLVAAPAAITLSTAGDATGLYTLDGAEVVTTFANGVLTGYKAGGDPTQAADQVFTITLDNVGATSADYTMQLNQPVRHSVDGTEDNSAPFTVDVSVMDQGGSTGGTSFTVSVDDDTPVVNDVSGVAVAEDGQVVIDLDASFGADGGQVTHIEGVELVFGSGDVSQVVTTEHGEVSYDRATQQFTYSPTAEFPTSTADEDAFTYRVEDGDGDTDEATVQVNVEHVADQPSDVLVEVVGTVVQNNDHSIVLGGQIGDQVGDDNIDGTPGFNYGDTISSTLDFGSTFANQTVTVTLDASISGSWNYDGSGSYFDDNWGVLVDGSPVAIFFYNASGSSAGPTSTETLPNGATAYYYGSPSSTNRAFNLNHQPQIQVTLDDQGRAELTFGAETTQTTESVVINGVAVAELPDTYVYTLNLQAALGDDNFDGSESLSVEILNVPAGAVLAPAAGSGLTVTNAGGGTWVVEVPAGVTSINGNVVLSVNEGPNGEAPDLNLSLRTVATEVDGDTAMSGTTPLVIQNGAVIDGVVAGMRYETTSGLSGVTDQDGRFNYAAGDLITLSVGSVVVGTFSAEALADDGKVFLQEIAGTGLEDLNHHYVENMAVFLQSLDSDADPYNGITVSEQAHQALAGTRIDLASASGTELQQTLAEAGFTPVSEADAMQHVRDMLSEHAGVTQFEEHVQDGPELLATSGDDIFAFALNEDGEAGESATIFGFGDAGSDALDLRDLLQGEEAEGADLTSYLDIQSDGTDTVIKVSVNGEFDGSVADTGHVDQTITLAGVDLVSGHDDLQSVIQSMLDSGKLNVDQ